ncbi:hypothetical protein J7K18_08450 [bacterium]|nr:hypothetical protein [bacterium]
MDLEQKISRFDKKYRSKGGFKKFKEMVNNLETLEAIGRHFGFSRQNAEMLYRSFFGGSYSDVARARRMRKLASGVFDIESELIRCLLEGKKRSYKRLSYVNFVVERLRLRSFSVSFLSGGSSFVDVYVNGKLVHIAGSASCTVYHFPRGRQPSYYYRFAVPRRECDFCVFVLDDPKHNFPVYIIPYEEIKGLSLLTLRSNYQRNSKYKRYLEAWELLR